MPEDQTDATSSPGVSAVPQELPKSSLAAAEEKQDCATIRAAQYVRMSTEHQKYSIANQIDAIRDYASRNGMCVIQTYADEGKSGLSLEGRSALKRLIADVEEGAPGFEIILVYDVSRWGRFQDADESAYYEYRCKRAGVGVRYCAEQFENDGSPISAIVKNIKRTMAGEYSRELSAKVFAGQRRIIELGFRLGSRPGYGLRRMLIDPSGVPKSELQPGEKKSIQNDRVVLVPGPAEEVEIVRWIYKAFAKDKLTPRKIADILNVRGIPNGYGCKWTRVSINALLECEKYAGNNVWNKSSVKLKGKRTKNGPESWIRADNAFEAIVDQNLFDSAQDILKRRRRRYSDAELLSRLRQIYEAHGYLSGPMIDNIEGEPASCTFKARLGGLRRAYQRIGVTKSWDRCFLGANGPLRRLYLNIIARSIDGIFRAGGHVEQNAKTSVLTINREFTALIVVSRRYATQSGSFRWHANIRGKVGVDIVVVARIDGQGIEPRDFYLFPSIDLNKSRIEMHEDNGLALDAYRFKSLDTLFGLAERAKLRDAA